MAWGSAASRVRVPFFRLQGELAISLGQAALGDAPRVVEDHRRLTLVGAEDAAGLLEVEAGGLRGPGEDRALHRGDVRALAQGADGADDLGLAAIEAGKDRVAIEHGRAAVEELGPDSGLLEALDDVLGVGDRHREHDGAHAVGVLAPVLDDVPDQLSAVSSFGEATTTSWSYSSPRPWPSAR